MVVPGSAGCTETGEAEVLAGLTDVAKDNAPVQGSELAQTGEESLDAVDGAAAGDGGCDGVVPA